MFKKIKMIGRQLLYVFLKLGIIVGTVLFMGCLVAAFFTPIVLIVKVIIG